MGVRDPTNPRWPLARGAELFACRLSGALILPFCVRSLISPNQNYCYCSINNTQNTVPFSPSLPGLQTFIHPLSLSLSLGLIFRIVYLSEDSLAQLYTKTTSKEI